MHKLNGQIYEHLNTGNRYEFLGMALLEATTETMVIYKCLNGGMVWVRPAKEFFDGRFVCILQNNDTYLKSAPPPSPKPKTTQPIH